MAVSGKAQQTEQQSRELRACVDSVGWRWGRAKPGPAGSEELAEPFILSALLSLSTAFLISKMQHYLNCVKQMAGAECLAHSRCSTNMFASHPFLGIGQTVPVPQPASPAVPTTLGLFLVIRLRQPTVSKPKMLSVPQAASVDIQLGGR